jgi:hypothetical protein
VNLYKNALISIVAISFFSTAVVAQNKTTGTVTAKDDGQPMINMAVEQPKVLPPMLMEHIRLNCPGEDTPVFST